MQFDAWIGDETHSHRVPARPNSGSPVWVWATTTVFM
jgi:hypothetical protein